MPPPRPPLLAPGIRWRLIDARRYEAAINRDFVKPVIADAYDRIARAGRDYVSIGVELRAATVSPNLVAQSVQLASSYFSAVKKWHKGRFVKTMRNYLGVRPDAMSDAGVDLLMQQRIQANVDLIRTIPQRFHADLTAKFIEFGQDETFDRARVIKLVRETGHSAGYNARRIARDQSSKFVAELNQIRQTEAGITQYVWSSSGDDRVRPTHRENDGKTFSWDDPPQNGTGPPGAEIQCRCVALGVIPFPTTRRGRRAPTP